MTDLNGKTGLIVGVANKRSIAWAIAQAASAAGARLAVTYQGERLEENVRELSAGAERSPHPALRCDRRCADRATSSPRSSVSSAASTSWSTAPRSRRVRSWRPTFRSSQTSRAGFKLSLDVSAYSLIALARGALPLMERRGGGSILTLTYLGSERVFQNYNVMGVAKAALEATVRYLAADLGPKNIRVNAISAGPIKTLAAAGISGFSSILRGLSRARPAAAHGRHGRGGRRGHVPPRPRRPRA